MAKYLGENGLYYLWGKIKEWVTNYTFISSDNNKSTINTGNNTIDIYNWVKSSTKPSYTADEISDGTTYKRYSAADQTKLSGIAEGAEVNVNADWNATSGDAQILNKPTIPDDSNLVHKSGDETIAGNKLLTGTTRLQGTLTGELYLDNDLYSGSKIRLKDNNNEGWVQIVKGTGTSITTLQQALDARNNVQPNWTLTTTTADDYIKNKPTIPTASNTTPKMDGATAKKGTETAFARGDHVHPSDTSKVSVSDTITEAQINVLFATTISFTINAVTYQANSGMTWADWVSSAYNTAGYVVYSTYVNTAYGAGVELNNTYVASTDTIIANTAYTYDESQEFE